MGAHEPAASTDEHDAAFSGRLASIRQHVSAGACEQACVQCFAESALKCLQWWLKWGTRKLAILATVHAYTAFVISPTAVVVSVCNLLQFASDAAAARDAQQLLQEAHKQAQRKEAEVLEAADAGVMKQTNSLAHFRLLVSATAPAYHGDTPHHMPRYSMHCVQIMHLVSLHALQPTHLPGGVLGCHPKLHSCSLMMQCCQAASCSILQQLLRGSRHTSRRRYCSRLQCLPIATSQLHRTSSRPLAIRRWAAAVLGVFHGVASLAASLRQQKKYCAVPRHAVCCVVRRFARALRQHASQPNHRSSSAARSRESSS